MAVIKLTIGSVNITNYLIVIARKVSDPSVIAAQEIYTPSQLTTNLNVVIPASGSLDATVYYIDFRESADGVTPGLLLGQMVYDAKIQVPISETRFYKTGGPRPIDPVADQTDLIDAYLDGKNITSIYKEGFRPLVPPGGATDSFKEYSLIIGGGIHLEQGQVFNFNEVLVVVITYVSTFEQTSSNAGLYDGVILITANITLTNTHRNKRLKCEATGSQLTVTLENISTVPAGKFYQFTNNGGNQRKTRIMAASGNVIRFEGLDWSEISIGKGEYIRLEKYDTYWEAINPHPAIAMVGERFVKSEKNVVNALALDGSEVSGNDEPRLFYYVNNLPANIVVIDSSLAAQLPGKEGLWVIDTAGRRLRLPNYQGFSQKGLKDFNTFGTDNTRTYDYPGGTQPAAVGDHKHWTLVNIAVNDGGFPAAPLNTTSVVRYFNKNGGSESMYSVGDAGIPSVGLTSNPTVTNENTVKNIGEIYHVRS